jgi:hypothetical protein
VKGRKERKPCSFIPCSPPHHARFTQKPALRFSSPRCRTLYSAGPWYMLPSSTRRLFPSPPGSLYSALALRSASLAPGHCRWLSRLLEFPGCCLCFVTACVASTVSNPKAEGTACGQSSSSSSPGTGDQQSPGHMTHSCKRAKQQGFPACG